MSEFVYHAVVDLLPGTDALLPVSALRGIDEAAYRRAISKYDDTPERRRLAQTQILVIDRGWTEVVFLSPVPPHAIWSAWMEIASAPPPMEFWQIPVESLPGDAVIFDRTMSSVGDSIDSSEVSRFDPERFQTAMQAPPANRARLASLAAAGRRGAWFNRTPHVVTAGPVLLGAATTVSSDAAPAP